MGPGGEAHSTENKRHIRGDQGSHAGTRLSQHQAPAGLMVPGALTFVLTQEQRGCQPSIHDGLLVQDGGGGGRELGVAHGGEWAT